MQEWENLKDIYRKCVFNKKELEEQLGIDLTTLQNIISVPEELKPFLSRKTIQLKEAANMMAGYHPFHWSDKSKYLDDVLGYRTSLWDAVDNNILTSKNLITHEDFGQEWRDDITLNKNEVTKWAKKYNYNWSLPIDDEIEESNQDNSELLQRIKQLEKELEEQKKINSESIYIPPLNIADTGNLVSENNQLKIDNQKLTKQLNDAKKEIEELKNNNLNEPSKKESPKTINAQAKFIKALLHHYYGENIANNPRPHIENNDGEIKRDFETQGLSKNLPTGVVVKKWVDSIELEIDS